MHRLPRIKQETVPDRHPIPRIQEALDSLGASHGLVSWTKAKPTCTGKYSQPLTTFVTPWGLYEWVWIPF